METRGDENTATVTTLISMKNVILFELFLADAPAMEFRQIGQWNLFGGNVGRTVCFGDTYISGDVCLCWTSVRLKSSCAAYIRER